MKINVAIIILFFTHICFAQNKIKKEVLETYSTSLKFGKPVIGKLESKLTHFYDINGNIITSIMETYSEWAFNSEPKITYKYNKNNKLIETNYFNIDGTLIKKIILLLNSKLKKIKKLNNFLLTPTIRIKKVKILSLFTN